MTSSKIPILFIHGNSENSSNWAPVMAKFARAGYSSLFAIDFKPNANESCITYAILLAEYVNHTILPQIPANSKFAIVCHSLGVTSARYYIRHLGGHNYVSHAILIAGANHGIASADDGLILDPMSKVFKQAPELHTGGSQFLKALKEGEEDGVRYMTLSSPHDYYYSMHECSPFLANADNRILPFVGHWGIRDSESSFTLMQAFLEDRAGSLPLGRSLIPIPDSPIGDWEFVAPSSMSKRFSFKIDQTVELKTSSGEVKQGKYRVCTGHDPCWIDVDFPEGQFHGVYRLNVNGDCLRLKFGELFEARPLNQRNAELFYKVEAKEPVLPKPLAGKWKCTDLSYTRNFGMNELNLDLVDGKSFKLSGKMSTIPSFELVGDCGVSKAGAEWKTTFLVKASTNPIFSAGMPLAALIRIEGDELLMELPFRTGTVRPQVIDNPLKFKKF